MEKTNIENTLSDYSDSTILGRWIGRATYIQLDSPPKIEDALEGVKDEMKERLQDVKDHLHCLNDITLNQFESGFQNVGDNFITVEENSHDRFNKLKDGMDEVMELLSSISPSPIFKVGTMNLGTYIAGTNTNNTFLYAVHTSMITSIIFKIKVMYMP